jgi:hypothetical protein
MGPLAHAAMVLVLALQPTLRMSTLPEPIVTTKVDVRANGETVQTVHTLRGWTTCTTTTYPDGQETGRVDQLTATPDSLEHELLHAVSCVGWAE